MRLTHYVPVLPSYRSQSIDLLCKSIDWFLYEGNTGTYWVNILIWTKKCLLNRLFYNMIHWSVWNDELILLFDKPIFLLLEGTRCFFSFITESFSLNSSGYFYFFNKIQYVRQVCWEELMVYLFHHQKQYYFQNVYLLTRQVI